MEINPKIKENLRIRAFYLFFIITSIQVGVGIMGAPMYIFTEAEQDSWLSIIIAFVYVLLVIFVMFRILEQYENADIFGIQVDIFGKWLGKILGTLYIIYFAAALLSVILTYIDVVKVFIFPEISSLIIGVLLISLIIYCIYGGLKVIIGVVFIFFFSAHWLLFLLYEPAIRMELDHFQPFFQASFPELLKGARATAYSFAGFEILLLIYPFIQNKESAKFPAYFGAFWSFGLLLIGTVISIGYFSAVQLKELEWAVLSLFKIVSLPFVERFDYIVVAEWMMVALPNMILLMWAITYGIKRMYKVPQTKTLFITSFILLILIAFMSNHNIIIRLTDLVAKVGFWVVYVYPFILFPIVLLKKRWQRKKESETR
ncbi:GerAB/ArcD/ProY family transporter [Virgibacillus litoralis]|uniref:Spore germination protein (Amino acid permease) n=1 Tax=Virgibacillus litoralis TaxID=578221 RepID=A0ABS4H8Z4_9BACI|nr:GerAB/ArcD/ProY family transporter [Virgibacillus litoralis]MBP1947379.1 spore germination protein (amino acid permease) [Virgibacillus litoralis]